MLKNKTLLLTLITFATYIIGLIALTTNSKEIYLSPSTERIASLSPIIALSILLIVILTSILIIYQNDINKKIKKRNLNKKFKKAVDKFIYFAAIISVLIGLPQILKIWVEKNASGVSIISWSAYFLTASIWFVYASIHKYKPIALAYFFVSIVNLIILIGAILYS